MQICTMSSLFIILSFAISYTIIIRGNIYFSRHKYRPFSYTELLPDFIKHLIIRILFIIANQLWFCGSSFYILIFAFDFIVVSNYFDSELQTPVFHFSEFLNNDYQRSIRQRRNL